MRIIMPRLPFIDTSFNAKVCPTKSETEVPNSNLLHYQEQDTVLRKLTLDYLLMMRLEQ